MLERGRRLTVRARAKVNLGLEVLGRRADGYHALLTFLSPVDLADRVMLETTEGSGPGGGDIAVQCATPGVPLGADNLAWRAADLLRREAGVAAGVRIRLVKAIPVAAGLGGGSHDPERAMRICAEAIPFLALLSIAATGLLAREIGGTLAGLGAAALLAFIPYQVEYTVVGRVDHHVLEPFFLAAVLVVFLRAAKARSPRARDGWALGCGALLALAFWFVTTAILIPAFLAAGIVLARALEALGRAERRVEPAFETDRRTRLG